MGLRHYLCNKKLFLLQMCTSPLTFYGFMFYTFRPYTFTCCAFENWIPLSSKFYQPIAARCCFSIRLGNIRKPKGFLMFSGGIEKQHRAVMGQSSNFFNFQKNISKPKSTLVIKRRT